MPTGTLFDYESDDSPVERRDGLTLSATRVFHVPWEDRYYWRGQLVDWPGDLYPYAPQFNCYCRSCDVKPFGQKKIVGGAPSAATIRYEQAILTAEYPSPSFSQPSQNPAAPSEIVSESFEPSMEFLTFPTASCRWKTQTKQENGDYKNEEVLASQAPGQMVAGMVYTLTRHNMAAVPQNVFDLVGSINKYEIQSKFLTTTVGGGGARIKFKPETLLYMPPSVRRTVMSDGSGAFAVTLKFMWQNRPTWNKFWRPILFTGVDGQRDAEYDTVQVKKVNGDYADYAPYPIADLIPILGT